MKSRVFAIIADDLTGSGDTGVQFAVAGLRTRVLLGEWTPESLLETDVIVLNTESRPLKAEEAYNAVLSTAKSAKEKGVYPIYKKIDSTMRGNVGVETDAMMDAFAFDMAIICPAFPDNGRTVIGGYLLVNGELVSRTSISRDPVSPVREAHIPTLLSKNVRRPVLSIDIKQLQYGPEKLTETLANFKRAGGSIVVIDAITNEDLETIVKSLFLHEEDIPYFLDEKGNPCRVILTGSAGLARPLAKTLAKKLKKEPPKPKLKTILLLIGSVNPVTREQLSLLKEKKNPWIITLDVSVVLENEHLQDKALMEALNSSETAINQGHNIMVLTTPADPNFIDSIKIEAEKRGIDKTTLSLKVAKLLAKLASLMLEKINVHGVIATGGDTARALLNELRGNGIDLISEVSPGVPVGTVSGGSKPNLKIITKAGGFGKPDILIQAVDYLVNMP
ncbi:MAG: four-carbon acid sugar kinase family protein [Synergistetes bacterium]|nr:four-carbon acid sugar kinase family protein [Synergistota bacterium]MCX8128304.1 four-carbon acid sugar kinase family protein [Synergistota bacterium]MDW8192623.1 four-carbon acid sugar kinase family protein [Synergistota bacterium]